MVIPSRESEKNRGPTVWCLNYFHNWAKPDISQRPHPKGKLWAETHGVYKSWEDAEAVRRTMSNPDAYHVAIAQNFVYPFEEIEKLKAEIASLNMQIDTLERMLNAEYP